MAKLTLDLSKGFALMRQLPTLATRATGLPIPESIRKAIPAIAVIGEMAEQLVVDEGESGLDIPGMDTGKLGAGKTRYLRQRDAFTDSHVSAAVRKILQSNVPAIEAGIQRIGEAIDYTLSLQSPGVNLAGTIQPSDKQLRTAVDAVLINSGALPEAISDKFGDMLYYTLKVTPAPRLPGGGAGAPQP